MTKGTKISVLLIYADIEADSSKTFTFSRPINYGPGEYVGTFYVDDKQLAESPAFRFTVVGPTNLDMILSAPDSEGKSAIYDLQGHPVKQLHKDKLYIGKDKFLVK